MRFLEFPPKAPPGSPFCHCDILRRARGFGPSHCPVGYWAPPSDFGLLPVKGRGEKVVLELWEGGREGCQGILVQLYGWHSWVFLFPQGGLGLFVQLMPILILIIVSALSQMMVSSPPYSLSHRPLVPIPLKLTHVGRGWALQGCGGAGILPLLPGFLCLFCFIS